MAEIKTTYVPLMLRTPGVLYEPAGPTDRQRIAVLVMHSDEDYLSFVTGPELAGRGYTVLCANVMSKEGVLFSLDQKIRSVRAAVEYLRSLPQVSRVVLMGHSGGGTLMSLYQAVAENGTGVFQNEDMIYPYPGNEAFPPADGIMLLDSNWGNAAMQLFSLDPAVQDEHSGRVLNEEFDLFNPLNGYDPDGAEYSLEFIRHYQQAQSERSNLILDYALSRLLELDLGKGTWIDDEPLIIPGAAQSFHNNKLYAQDPRLMSRTRKEHLLLHPDGSRSVQIVSSARGLQNPESSTASFWEGARILSIRTYLSSYAIRTGQSFGYDEDHVWGIEWDSAYSCPPGNMAHVQAPTLIMGMTAGWEFLAAETIWEWTAARDKTLAFVEGATHRFTPAKQKGQDTSPYGDTVKTLHDFVDAWLSSGRF